MSYLNESEIWKHNSVTDLKNNNPMGNWTLGKDSGTIKL